MKIFGIELVPEGFRWPRLVSHVVDSDSKTETLGFLVFFAATYGAFFVKETDGTRVVHVVTSDQWMWSNVISSILIGGRMVTRSLLEAMQLKTTGKMPAAEPEPAPAAKGGPDAAAAQ